MSTLANCWKKLLFDADLPVVDFAGFESEDFIKRFKAAGEEVSEENLEEWLAIDDAEYSSEVLTDAEIVESVLQPEKDDGNEEEDKSQTHKIPLSRARFYCDELLRFVSERETAMPKQGYEQLHIIR